MNLCKQNQVLVPHIFGCLANFHTQISFDLHGRQLVNMVVTERGQGNLGCRGHSVFSLCPIVVAFTIR